MPNKFNPKQWFPGILGGTPITDVELNRAEVGIESADDRLDALFVVDPPTGIVVTDTALVQNMLDAAAAQANGGVAVLSPGCEYVVSGVTINTNVVLDLNHGGLKLANNADASVVNTVGYDNLILGDTTGGPRDFAIINGYLDGNKSNQTVIDKPVLAIYGRRYNLVDLVIRNGKGTGLRSQWSTNSAFLAPNGFESFVTNLYLHSCDGHGIDFSGPHDTYFSTFFIVKCSISATTYPLYLPDASGRANGSGFQQFHVYGGDGYNYGVVINTAGVRVANFVVEGGQLAQVALWASQIMLDGFHLYTGGIATATAKGITVGDASHTNVNGCTIRGRIENCGGGCIDLTNAGWNNDIDVHHFYISGTAPAVADLGIVGTVPLRTRLLLRATDSATSFAPTISNRSEMIGPVRTIRTTSGDTRDLVDARNELGQQMFRLDWRGRRRVCTGTGGPIPTIAVGANAGSGATVAITGDDTAGKITVTTGTGPTAGTLATVTFSGSWGNAPFVVITPKDVLGAVLAIYNGTGTTLFSIKCANTPVASTIYTFDYVVVGA